MYDSILDLEITELDKTLTAASTPKEVTGISVIWKLNITPNNAFLQTSKHPPCTGVQFIFSITSSAQGEIYKQECMEVLCPPRLSLLTL
jgi:hypothetical protein